MRSKSIRGSHTLTVYHGHLLRTALEMSNTWFPILLCTAAVGLVHPVTREVDYIPSRVHSNLHGLPLKKPFDAHFALVSSRHGYEAAPPAEAEYGELCVSQNAAVLPLATLWVST